MRAIVLNPPGGPNENMVLADVPAGAVVAGHRSHQRRRHRRPGQGRAVGLQRRQHLTGFEVAVVQPVDPGRAHAVTSASLLREVTGMVKTGRRKRFSAPGRSSAIDATELLGLAP